MLVFLMLCYFTTTSHGQFVLNKYLPTCDYKLKHEDITVAEKDWIVTVDNTEIIFNLCILANHKRCDQHSACIKNITNSSVVYFENRFEPDGDKLILRSNDTKCKLSIKWDCTLSSEEEPKMEIKSHCIYEISLKAQSNSCNPPCGTILNTQLLDLSPLTGKYIVHSKDRIFSIFMCDLNPDCDDRTASSCDITNATKPILIASGDELIKYNEETHEIDIHEKTKFKGKEKIYDLFIKCNWSANKPIIQYKEVLIQGKKYRFEMESRHGCVKLPPQCEFTDNNYRYNLTKAYSSTGYIEVKKVPNNKQIFLNVCGPLQISKTDNICNSSYSQVCEKEGNEYINRGSIYSKPVISDENISMSIISGSRCHYNTSKNYQTKIHFYCSKYDEHPQYVNEENCELFISWNTPAACPEHNIDSCENIHRETFDCLYKVTSKNINYTFDLSRLNHSVGYLIQDQNENIEYLMNICGPVKEPDAPCKKNAMVTAKYLDEFDLRKKVKSFGQFTKLDLQNENLVIETSVGEFCFESSSDYKSTIFFECSYKESEISIKSATNCTVDFLWKSKHACLNFAHNCVFPHPLSDKYMLDFTTMGKQVFSVTLNGTNYFFDICGNKKSECQSKDCIYVPFKKSVVVYDKKTYLEFYLNRPCDERYFFNKTMIELVCDNIERNEHYIVPSQYQKGCTLIFQLKTNHACFNEDVVIPLIGHKNEVQYKVDTVIQKTKDEEKVTVDTGLTNCTTVKNIYTGYEFNISQLNVKIPSSICPTISFNFDKQMVSLIYDVPNGCSEEKNKQMPLDFRIILKCKNHDFNNITKTALCAKNYTYELPAACKLLDTHILDGKSTPLSHASSGKITTIVVSVMVLIILIVCSLLWWRKWRMKRSSTNGLLNVYYEKNADL